MPQCLNSTTFRTLGKKHNLVKGIPIQKNTPQGISGRAKACTPQFFTIGINLNLYDGIDIHIVQPHLSNHIRSNAAIQPTNTMNTKSCKRILVRCRIGTIRFNK